MGNTTGPEGEVGIVDGSNDQFGINGFFLSSGLQNDFIQTRKSERQKIILPASFLAVVEVIDFLTGVKKHNRRLH